MSDWFHDLFIREAACAKSSVSGYADTFFTTKFSGVTNEIIIEPSTVTETIDIVPVGYRGSDRKIYIHDGAIIEVYKNGEKYLSFTDSSKISSSYTYTTDDVYGNLTYMARLDKTTTLYNVTIKIPPVTETTTFKLVYKYPDGKCLKDEFMPNNL